QVLARLPRPAGDAEPLRARVTHRCQAATVAPDRHRVVGRLPSVVRLAIPQVEATERAVEWVAGERKRSRPDDEVVAVPAAQSHLPARRLELLVVERRLDLEEELCPLEVDDEVGNVPGQIDRFVLPVPLDPVHEDRPACFKTAPEDDALVRGRNACTDDIEALRADGNRCHIAISHSSNDGTPTGITD